MDHGRMSDSPSSPRPMGGILSAFSAVGYAPAAVADRTPAAHSAAGHHGSEIIRKPRTHARTRRMAVGSSKSKEQESNVRLHPARPEQLLRGESMILGRDRENQSAIAQGAAFRGWVI